MSAQVRLPGYGPQQHPPPWRGEFKTEPARAAQYSIQCDLSVSAKTILCGPRLSDHASPSTHVASSRKEHASSVRGAAHCVGALISLSNPNSCPMRSILNLSQPPYWTAKGGAGRRLAAIRAFAADDLLARTSNKRASYAAAANSMLASSACEDATEPKMPPWALIILSPMSWNSGK
jgi:hypothetical protein